MHGIFDLLALHQTHMQSTLIFFQKSLTLNITFALNYTHVALVHMYSIPLNYVCCSTSQTDMLHIFYNNMYLYI